MRFAISIPQFVSDGEFDPARFRAYMARAEALGFESAWTLEQTLGTMPFMSPLQTMSYAAACTERIRLGCVVFVTPLHSPVHLAKDLTTLDQLSRGRIEVGVGTGGRHRMFSAVQVDPTSLVARFNEGLRLMKALWTEPRVDFDGRFWQLKDAAMEPKPFQKPHPPIWFGASHPVRMEHQATQAPCEVPRRWDSCQGEPGVLVRKHPLGLSEGHEGTHNLRHDRQDYCRGRYSERNETRRSWRRTSRRAIWHPEPLHPCRHCRAASHSEPRSQGSHPEA